MRITVAVLGAVALLAAPAHARDVARVPLGSNIESLVAGPDGGAWVGISGPLRDSVGRALPGGGYRTSASEHRLAGGVALGPDGQAWFTASDLLVRADGAGSLSLTGPFDAIDDFFGPGVATGPDGTLWAITHAEAHRLVRISPQGTATAAPLRPEGCTTQLPYEELVRAADGAVWAATVGCERLVRIAPDGRPSVFRTGGDAPERLAADAAGGVWYAASSIRGFGGHVDAAGRASRIVSDERATDVAVAPDGGVWFALGRCAIARVNGAQLETRPIPIPAHQLAFDRSGGVWLASRTRLVHAPLDGLAGPCDEAAPIPRVARRISLAALRRGLRITVREPAIVSAFAEVNGRSTVRRTRTIRGARGGSFRLRLPARMLRRVARGDRIGLYIRVEDRNGNHAVTQPRVRVT